LFGFLVYFPCAIFRYVCWVIIIIRYTRAQMMHKEVVPGM
jgi:hypothetical protein